MYFDDLEERFVEFLRLYKNDDGVREYFKQIQMMPIDGDVSITVDFHDLSSFDNIFYAVAEEDPRRFLEMANNALVSVLRVDDPNYIAGLDSSDIKIHFTNYPERIPIHMIRSKHIGKMIQITGIVEKTDDIKLVLSQGLFMCRICHERIPQIQPQMTETHSKSNPYPTYLEPHVCPICDKKTPVRLLPSQSKFIDWQKIRLMKTPEIVPPNDSPASIDVILDGDLVGKLKPGDYAGITGILIHSPDIPLKSGRMTTFESHLHVVGIRIIPNDPLFESSELERFSLLIYNEMFSNIPENLNMETFPGGIFFTGRKFRYGCYTFTEEFGSKGHKIMIVRKDDDEDMVAAVDNGEYHSVS
ncbi:MAG: hypothetical protein ACTSWQ_01185 [Candidatus Thorarchaeota archaeon]